MRVARPQKDNSNNVHNPARGPVLLFRQHGRLVDLPCSSWRRNQKGILSAPDRRPHERTGPPARVWAPVGRHMFRPRHVERAPSVGSGGRCLLIQEQQPVPVAPALGVDVQRVLHRVVVVTVPVPMHPEGRRELGDGACDLVPRSSRGKQGCCGGGCCRGGGSGNRRRRSRRGGSLVVSALAADVTAAAAVQTVAVVIGEVADGGCRRRQRRRRR